MNVGDLVLVKRDEAGRAWKIKAKHSDGKFLVHLPTGEEIIVRPHELIALDEWLINHLMSRIDSDHAIFVSWDE